MGFRKIGDWLLEKDEPSFRLSHYHYEHDPVLYAFICDEKLVYIGKTDEPFEKFFWNFTYKYSKEGDLIRTALSEYKPIELHMLPDNGLLYFGGLQMNLANGLFASMIQEFSPEWNTTLLATSAKGYAKY